MNKEQFVNTFSTLAMLYGKEYTLDQLNAFYLLLSDIDIGNFKTACGNLAKKLKFMPTVADIREEVANIVGGSELSLEPEHEWEEVLHCIRTYGSYHKDDVKKYLNPFTYWICEKMGWNMFYELKTDQKEFVGHKFIEYFKSNQRDYKEQLQVGNMKDIKKINYENDNLIKKIEMN